MVEIYNNNNFISINLVDMRWPNASLQCYATMAMLKVLKVLKIQLKALSEIGKKARCHITLCCTFHKNTLQLYLIARQLQRLL